MTTLTNSAEGGTNAATVTAGSGGNSGGTSGSFFDAVTIAATGACIFDNAHVARGSLAYKFTAGATAGSTFVTWSSSLTGTSVAQAFFRAYLWIPSPEITNEPIVIQARAGAAGANAAGGIQFVIPASTLLMRLVDANASTLVTGAVAVPTNTWIRVEGFVKGSATAGQIEAKLFTSPYSTTPAETLTSVATANTSGAITAVRFGLAGTVVTAAQNTSVWMDEIAVSDTAYLGATQSRLAAISPEVSTSATPDRRLAGVSPEVATRATTSRRVGAISVEVATSTRSFGFTGWGVPI